MKNKRNKGNAQQDQFPFERDQDTAPEKLDKELNDREITSGSDWDSEEKGVDVTDEMDTDVLSDEAIDDDDDEV